MTKRSNGEGSFYFNKEKEIWIFQVSYMDAGKRERKQFAGKTKGKAREKADKFLKALEAKKREQGWTVRSWVDKWLEEYAKPRLRDRSYEKYRSSLNYIVAALGDALLDDIKPLGLQECLNSLLINGGQGKRGLSTSTVRAVRRYFTACLDDAVAAGVLAANPMLATKAPKLETKQIKVLSKEQTDVMLAEAAKVDSEFYGMMMPVLIRLALNTGARQGELFALRWSDVDFDGQFIDINKALVYAVGKGAVVQSPKTKSSQRKVYITSEDAKVLKDYKKQQQDYAEELGDLFDWQDNLVFTSQFGRPIRPSNFIRRWWKPLLVKCGLPENITFHQLRHYHASVLLSEGVPIKVVQERLGHATSRMTLEVYAHVMPNTQERAVEALERYARK